MTHLELATAMSDLGLTRMALAQLCGVERETVYRWLRDPEAKGALPVPGYVEQILTMKREIARLSRELTGSR